MDSLVRFVASATMLVSIYGYSLGDMPSQTIGVGLPLIELLPTQAPSVELVKKSLGEKRAITNVCYEWTLDGLGGTPLCGASATCLFTSASDGFLYEGCGQTDISYDWITACYPYPQTQTGTAPSSEVWCPASAPACGYFAFVYDIGQTFWNFGCSTRSFSSTARLLASSSVNALAGAFGVTVTDISTAKDPATTFAPTKTGKSSSTPTGEATGIVGPGSGSSTSLPAIKSNLRKKKKVPLGPIIGGVIGGMILIIAICILVWFCIRKNRRNKAAKLAEQQTQQTTINPTNTPANQSQQRYSELGGDWKPQPPPAAYINSTVYEQTGKPFGGGYTKPPVEIHGQISAAFKQSAPQHGNQLGGTDFNVQRPSPTYAQQQQPSLFSTPTHQDYPQNNYTELPNNGRQSIPLVSPVGTYISSDLGQGGANACSPAARLSNLSTPTLTENAYSPPSEMGAIQQPSPTELGSTQHRPHEMSGTGGIARRPVRKSAGMDMSGNPTTENYPHELA